VKSSTLQLLVVGESYHSGWQARVDNQPASVLRTDGDFMGVVIAPGDHEITLKFQPESLHYGRLASGFGLSLLVVVMAAAGWPWRRRND
ncbi:MAG TPA: YfhO family protein, partial [Pirellulales bacterium]|nr:YfhO family protein [Pirellulales bacterium]